jgi:hypothetical protein
MDTEEEGGRQHFDVTAPTGQYVVDDGERKREIMRMSSAELCVMTTRRFCWSAFERCDGKRDTVPHFLRRNSKAGK